MNNCCTRYLQWVKYITSFINRTKNNIWAVKWVFRVSVRLCVSMYGLRVSVSVIDRFLLSINTFEKYSENEEREKVSDNNYHHQLFPALHIYNNQQYKSKTSCHMHCRWIVYIRLQHPIMQFRMQTNIGNVFAHDRVHCARVKITAH